MPVKTVLKTKYWTEQPPIQIIACISLVLLCSVTVVQSFGWFIILVFSFYLFKPVWGIFLSTVGCTDYPLKLYSVFDLFMWHLSYFTCFIWLDYSSFKYFKILSFQGNTLIYSLQHCMTLGSVSQHHQSQHLDPKYCIGKHTKRMLAIQSGNCELMVL